MIDYRRVSLRVMKVFEYQLLPIHGLNKWMSSCWLLWVAYLLVTDIPTSFLHDGRECKLAWVVGNLSQAWSTTKLLAIANMQSHVSVAYGLQSALFNAYFIIFPTQYIQLSYDICSTVKGLNDMTYYSGQTYTYCVAERVVLLSPKFKNIIFFTETCANMFCILLGYQYRIIP